MKSKAKQSNERKKYKKKLFATKNNKTRARMKNYFSPSSRSIRTRVIYNNKAVKFKACTYRWFIHDFYCAFWLKYLLLCERILNARSPWWKKFDLTLWIAGSLVGCIRCWPALGNTESSVEWRRNLLSIGMRCARNETLYTSAGLFSFFYLLYERLCSKWHMPSHDTASYEVK